MAKTFVSITNVTRGSFRRAGIRFPAKADGPMIINAEDLTDAQKTLLENEPRLRLEPAEDPATLTPKKGGGDAATIKANAAHEKAMTAARKIKDPVKRQAAQDKANDALTAAIEANANA